MEAQVEEKGYQGWKNYETWAVALWVDNDRGFYNARRELVADALTNALGMSQVEEGIWTQEQANKFMIADTLKEWVEEMVPDLGATLWSDLLNAALSEVDWTELAEHWIDED